MLSASHGDGHIFFLGLKYAAMQCGVGEGGDRWAYISFRKSWTRLVFNLTLLRVSTCKVECGLPLYCQKVTSVCKSLSCLTQKVHLPSFILLSKYNPQDCGESCLPHPDTLSPTEHIFHS